MTSAPQDTQPILIDNSLLFHKDGNDKLIVFVHGLMGDAVETWTFIGDEQHPKFYWPEKLFNDPEFAEYDVLSFDYESGCGPAYTIKQLAQSLKTMLDGTKRKYQYKSLSFVAHSLGGLGVRQYILDEHKKQNIESVVLLATPNHGNSLAELGVFFCNNPQWEELAHGGVIDYMGEQWFETFEKTQTSKPFLHSAAYELKPVEKYWIIKKIIVEKYSAIMDAQERRGFLKDHETISKPYGYDDQLYDWTRQRLLQNPVEPELAERSETEEQAIPETLGKLKEAVQGTELEKAENLIEIGDLDGALKLLDQTQNKETDLLAKTHFVKAGIYKLQIKYEKAREHYEEAARLAPQHSLYLNEAGFILDTLSQYDQAMKFYEKALECDLKTYGPRHSKIAIRWNNLGAALYSQGQYDKAIEYYEKALESDLKTYGPGHPQVAIRRNNLGAAWKAKGKYDKAIDYFEKALESDLKTFGPWHPKVAIRWNNLGTGWDSKGQYGKAIGYYEKALKIDIQTYGPGHPQVAIRWNNLGTAWKAKGQYGKAIGYYEKALESDLKTYGPEHPSVARDWNNLGGAWLEKREYDKAIEYFKKSLESNLKTYGSEHPDVAINWNNLGEVWRVKGDYDKANDYYGKALESALKTYGSEHPQLAIYWNNLGLAWLAKEDYKKAREYMEKALDIFHKAGLEHMVKKQEDNLRNIPEE